MTDTEKNTTIQEPLLEDCEHKDELLKTSAAVKKVSMIAKNIIIGALFHPLYHIVNALVLGHEETPEPLAGVGLGSLTVGMLGFSVGSSFSSGVATFVAQSYG